jgi:hypothetical protein
MNQPTVLDPARPRRAGRGLQLGLGVAGLALVAALAVTFVAGLSGGPSTVARITFENPTVYALDIEVSPGTGTGWTSAGSVRQQSTAVVQEVVDQGDVWRFRFDSQGETGGEVRLTRAELEASGWRVAIPEEVGSRLAQAGAPPTP